MISRRQTTFDCRRDGCGHTREQHPARYEEPAGVVEPCTVEGCECQKFLFPTCTPRYG